MFPNDGSGAPPTDRRTRHRQERADRVYEVAIGLFVEKGFDDTTMDEIAERADVARASVFNYFEHKTALLEEWIARMQRRVADVLAAEHRETDPIELTLSRWVAVVSAQIEGSRAEMGAMLIPCASNLNLITDSPYGRLLGGYLAAAKRRSEIRKTVDADRAGMLMVVGYFNICDAWVRAEGSFDIHKELTKLVDLLLDGILVPNSGSGGSRPRRVRAPRRTTSSVERGRKSR